MLKNGGKKIFAILGVFLMGTVLWASSSWDSERIELEGRLQQRIEETLSKILLRNSFLVVVRVEPWDRPLDVDGQPIEDEGGFYLPGVPRRARYDGTQDQIKDLVNSIKPDSPLFKRFIRRISTTLVLDEKVEEKTVEQVRELTRQMVGLNAARGDTLDIQISQLVKPELQFPDSGITRFQKEVKSYWLIISLSLILFCVTVFFLFIFGPLRGFLNRFVQVLPSLKPVENSARGSRLGIQEIQQLLPGLVAQQIGMIPPGVGGNASNFSGSLQVENPNKNVTPFGFIREDHLSNLSTLLSRETPERAAVVLGYLPPEWISRVLTRIDAQLQSEIASQLATTKQLLPEQVEDIEQDLKRRLDYLVGGPERIGAIYESLDAEAQKKMLDNLKDFSPELAEELRRRTLLFEDLGKLNDASLKALLREIDLQLLVTSLAGMDQEFIEKILSHVSTGKAEIIREELEMNSITPGRATKEAQRKVALLARRMEREGHIQIPEVHSSVTREERYGGAGSLRDVLKLPPGMKVENTVVEEGQISGGRKAENIEDRIKKFMNRGGPEPERYPLEGDSPEKQANE